MKNYKKVEHLLIKRIYYVTAKNKVEAESLIENGAYNNVVDENMETKSSRHIEEVR
jgi:hypothetical protein